MSSWHGHWYVVGHDLDRDAVRIFRLSRVVGPVRTSGRPGSFDVPEGTDVRALSRSLDPTPEATDDARLKVRRGAGVALRRRATDIEPGDPWDLLTVPFAGVWSMAEQIVSYGADVVVVEPSALRSAVVQLLERLAGADVGAGSDDEADRMRSRR
jgi:proteasome accessory factor B